MEQKQKLCTSALGKTKGTQRRDSGAILLIVLVLIFAVTLALLGYLYLNKNNSLIASNLAVQNAAQEATDFGVSDASDWLKQLPQYPEVIATSGGNTAPRFFMNMPTNGYLANGIDPSTVPIQAPTDPAFWSTCAGKYCYQVPNTVTFAGQSFTVEYVIFPSPARPQQIGGTDQKQAGNNNNGARYYVVYTHAQRTSGGGLGVTVQAVIQLAGG